jgi:hypothetical protein
MGQKVGKNDAIFFLQQKQQRIKRVVEEGATIDTTALVY